MQRQEYIANQDWYSAQRKEEKERKKTLEPTDVQIDIETAPGPVKRQKALVEKRALAQKKASVQKEAPVQKETPAKKPQQNNRSLKLQKPDDNSGDSNAAKKAA